MQSWVGFAALLLSVPLQVRGSCSTPVIPGAVKVLIDGKEHYYNVIDPSQGNAVSVEGDEVTLQHGSRVYLGDKCVDAMASDMFWHPDLKNYNLSFTVDLSKMECGCNAALYLVGMPAATKTTCGDYYCDANQVCGELCTEMDVLEGNRYAARVTAHKCDDDTTNGSGGDGGTAATCDGSGCGLQASGFGPGADVIDTDRSFTVTLSVGSRSGTPGDGSLLQTTFTQEGSDGGPESMFTFDDTTCGSGYLQAMAKSWKEGLVLTASNWGDTSDGSDMAWLDGDVCSASIGCSQGAWSFSNIRLESNDNNETTTWWDDLKHWLLNEDHPWWVWALLVLGVLLVLTCLGWTMVKCMKLVWGCLCCGWCHCCASKNASSLPVTEPIPSTQVHGARSSSSTVRRGHRLSPAGVRSTSRTGGGGGEGSRSPTRQNSSRSPEPPNVRRVGRTRRGDTNREHREPLLKTDTATF